MYKYIEELLSKWGSIAIVALKVIKENMVPLAHCMAIANMKTDFAPLYL